MGFIGFHRQREPSEIRRMQNSILTNLGITQEDLEAAGVTGGDFPAELEGLVGPEQEFYCEEDVSGLKNTPETISTDIGAKDMDLVITADAGCHQLEINFPPVDSFNMYRKLLREVDKKVGRDIYCIGEMPGGATFDDWIDNSRYTALKKAFKAESNEYHSVANIARAYALHFHFDYDPFKNEGGLALLNMFNNIGPLLERAFNSVVGVPAHRNRRYWSDWASPKRLPAYRWFESPEHLKKEVMSIPQLIKVRDEGGWNKYMKPPTRWNPAHAGTIYYLARPTSEYRVELRVFASMSPLMCVFALRVAMYYAVRVLRGEKEEIPYQEEDDWEALF